MESPNTMKAKVSTKGWVVIPAALRRRHGLKPGSLVEFRDLDGRIVIIPRVKDAIETLYGKFAAETFAKDMFAPHKAKKLSALEVETDSEFPSVVDIIKSGHYDEASDMLEILFENGPQTIH